MQHPIITITNQLNLLISQQPLAAAEKLKKLATLRKELCEMALNRKVTEAEAFELGNQMEGLRLQLVSAVRAEKEGEIEPQKKEISRLDTIAQFTAQFNLNTKPNRAAAITNQQLPVTTNVAQSPTNPIAITAEQLTQYFPETTRKSATTLAQEALNALQPNGLPLTAQDIEIVQTFFDQIIETNSSVLRSSLTGSAALCIYLQHVKNNESATPLIEIARTIVERYQRRPEASEPIEPRETRASYKPRELQASRAVPKGYSKIDIDKEEVCLDNQYAQDYKQAIKEVAGFKELINGTITRFTTNLFVTDKKVPKCFEEAIEELALNTEAIINKLFWTSDRERGFRTKTERYFSKIVAAMLVNGNRTGEVVKGIEGIAEATGVPKKVIGVALKLLEKNNFVLTRQERDPATKQYAVKVLFLTKKFLTTMKANMTKVANFFAYRAGQDKDHNYLKLVKKGFSFDNISAYYLKVRIQELFRYLKNKFSNKKIDEIVAITKQARSLVAKTFWLVMQRIKTATPQIESHCRLAWQTKQTLLGRYFTTT